MPSNLSDGVLTDDLLNRIETFFLQKKYKCTVTLSLTLIKNTF